MPGRLVLVEDDKSIGRSLLSSLTDHGYFAEWCRDVASATATLEQAVPDLVLLDANLPDGDGFSLCRWIRGMHAELPIIMVTARDAEIDIVVGLDAGASDYVTKPFSMNVLLARIRAHLRQLDAYDPKVPLHCGTLTVDTAAYLATIDGGVAVDLRRREFELLVFLVRETGRVVTRERLLSEVWDVHWDTSTKTLDMHIGALRRKLGPAVDIATVRGVGYRLSAP